MAVYPWLDWLRDYDWFRQATSKHPPRSGGMGIELFEEHFYSTRPNRMVGRHCLERFYAAMSYLDENSHAIFVDTLGVAGQDVSLFSDSVLFTLYRFFVGRPDEYVDMPIPIDLFLREARDDNEHPPRSRGK